MNSRACEKAQDVRELFVATPLESASAVLARVKSLCGQGAGDIFVMRFDGTNVCQLTDDAFEEATPAFAPRPR